LAGYFWNLMLHLLIIKRKFLGTDPALGHQGEPPMTDQELLVSTIREAGRIIAEYLEPDALGAEETLSRLIAVLDTEDLARAVERLEKGHGLRVVK
jgi:hypothetical protein